MADHYNYYPLKHFADIVANCIELPLPKQYSVAPAWIPRLLKERLGGPADRAVLYHGDALGMYIWQKNPDLFAPVHRHTGLTLPYLSTVESVTPVAHASMYTGMDPEGHGIMTYTRPQLACDTLFDQLIAAGKKVAIVCCAGDTFDHIFRGRELDYFPIKGGTVYIQEKVLELIALDKYDVISIHTCGYDNAAHAYGPESKEALNATSLETETFEAIARALEAQYKGKHRTLLTFSPDHGQHEVDGEKGKHGSKMIEDMNILHFFGTI